MFPEHKAKNKPWELANVTPLPQKLSINALYRGKGHDQIKIKTKTAFNISIFTSIAIKDALNAFYKIC